MHAEKTVAMSQTTLRDAIVGIPGLNKDAVNTLVTTESQSGVKRTDDHPQAMLQSLVNKKLDDILNSVKFKSSLLQKTEEKKTPGLWVTKMTAAILQNEDCIALVAMLDNNEAKKQWMSG